MVALKGTHIEAVPVTGEMKTQRLIQPDKEQLVWYTQSAL